MGKLEKSLWQILSGKSDQNVVFTDLIYVLESLGFKKRIKGSHHLFSKDGVEEIINIQPVDGKAKTYQVKQVRAVIVKYQLIGE
ncbi:MAG: type II toxin-antitoxin system HicA family toxin [Pseudomonadota bacterium]|nr:type II toxin-antitoxin system HicA family toxin [Pseudomonadota bacterium]MDP1905223.1 type II toxin-antitoxin system HicA family toxin [Pseudomonadota bacterium]MDP2352785.1 type II toxin-antitoxin system HicA family toxin [Pseudomonadota bacterium]